MPVQVASASLSGQSNKMEPLLPKIITMNKYLEHTFSFEVDHDSKDYFL